MFCLAGLVCCFFLKNKLNLEGVKIFCISLTFCVSIVFIFISSENVLRVLECGTHVFVF